MKAYFLSSWILMSHSGPDQSVRMEINFFMLWWHKRWNFILLIVWIRKQCFTWKSRVQGGCNWTFTICLFFLEHPGSSNRIFLSQWRHSYALSCLFCLENSSTQDNDDNNSNILTPKSLGKMVTSCLEIIGQWQNGKITMTQTRQGRS